MLHFYLHNYTGQAGLDPLDGVAGGHPQIEGSSPVSPSEPPTYVSTNLPKGEELN